MDETGTTTWFARQPLFARDGGLVGYELLYRSGGQARDAAGSEPEQMAAQVVADAVLATDLDALTAGTRAFLNTPRGLLTSRALELIDPGRIVVEILETVTPEPDVVEACARLRRKGYTIALDDFAPGDPRGALLPYVSYVKFDVLERRMDDVLEQAAPLAREANLRLVAERVETMDVYHGYAEAGFDVFQGYFFQRPEILSNRDLRPAQLRLVQSLNLVTDERVSDQRIAQHFKGDPSLAYQVVRIANVATIGARNIQSVQHAIQLVGRDALFRWIGLLIAASRGRTDGLHRELLRTALTRAHMCESLGASLGTIASGHLFLVGLFSRLDALLGIPLPQLLPRIALPELASAALLDHRGPYARVLAAVQAYEAADWDALEAAGSGFEGQELLFAYDQAVRWADAVSQEI